MQVYHLGASKFATQLSGEGAKLFGGRWNNIGQPCIYTSESQALGILEYAANVSLENIPHSLSITVYMLPDDGWKEFKLSDLPKDWNEVPAPRSTMEFGTAHLQKGRYLALKLPSVIIPTEYNFILNPLHPDFKKIRIKEVLPFNFDARIKK